MPESNEKQITSGVPMDKFVRRCASCKHWEGDKLKVADAYATNPQSMDLFEGWPEDGGCKTMYEWAEIIINGNASVNIKLPANFGCPYWAS